MTPHDYMFDIGRTTEESFEHFLTGFFSDQWGGGKVSDNGNGALIRISPLVFLLWNEYDFKKRLDLVEEIAHVTHRHLRSTVGSILYIEFLVALFNNNEPLEAYEQAVRVCLRDLKGTKSAYERVLNPSIPHLSKDGIVG